MLGNCLKMCVEFKLQLFEIAFIITNKNNGCRCFLLCPVSQIILENQITEPTIWTRSANSKEWHRALSPIRTPASHQATTKLYQLTHV